MVGDSVRVSTIDHVEEFRVHRIVWMSPESFLITGLDKRMKFKRIHLRMLTNSEATLAASAITTRFGIQHEPLSTVEEILVKAHFPLRGRELLVFAYQFAIRTIIGGFFLYAGLVLIGPIGFLVSAWVLVILVLIAWLFVRRRKLRVDAWLKFEHGSMTIRTNTDLMSIVPKTVQWKSSQMFNLTGSRRTVQIYSTTHEEAVQLISKIRGKFPQINETIE